MGEGDVLSVRTKTTDLPKVCWSHRSRRAERLTQSIQYSTGRRANPADAPRQPVGGSERTPWLALCWRGVPMGGCSASSHGEYMHRRWACCDDTALSRVDSYDGGAVTNLEVLWRAAVSPVSGGLTQGPTRKLDYVMLEEGARVAYRPAPRL